MPAIGIDLGTTFSCVGVFQHGEVKIIANDQGNRTTPSYVAFTDTVRLIGDPAKSQVDRNPENTVFGVKRLIGRKYNDPRIAEDIQNWPFKVCDSGGKPKISVMYKGEHKLFTPEEISAMVLRKMKETAETYLGEKVTDAVITVPACFNDSQRQATKDAGTIAGLHVLGIINEPTAAALAYGLGKDIKDERNVLMFDVGGGTFDASIVAIEESVFEVKATAGNSCLGGEDFDNRMVSFSEIVFASNHTKNLRTNARAIQRLRTACERAKRALSSSEEASIEIEALFEGIDHYSKIERVVFAKQCADLLHNTLVLVGKALTDAKIDKSYIHDVVLVGGSTRIPVLQKLLRDYFNGKELCMSLNLDEAVAYGAAVQAAELAGGKSEKIHGLLIADVIPFSLGIETDVGVMTRIIRRNSCIPRKTWELFTTYSDNQTSITIKVFEGDREMTKHNHFLGKFELSGIPPARGGVPLIEVTFVVDASGILHAFAFDKRVGMSRMICVTSDKGLLTEEEINRMSEETERYQQEDENQREKVSALNSLEAYVYSAKQAAVSADRFSQADKKEVNDICEDVIKWLYNNTLADKEEIEYKMKEVKGQLSPIIRKLQDVAHNSSSSASHSTRSVMISDVELSP